MALPGRGRNSAGRSAYGSTGRVRGGGTESKNVAPSNFELKADASIKLETLHEDESVLAISKPAGVLAHPSPGFWHGGTVAHAVVSRMPSEMLEERGNHGEWDSFIPRCIVHRLDAGTTGVMLLAKNPRAEIRLTEEFRTADAPRSPESMTEDVGKKMYVTFLLGHPGGSSRRTCITVVGAIGRDPNDRRRWAVVPDGKHAKSVVRVHGYNAEHDISLATVELFSGRTHQIRVHCAHIGAPVASDDVYAPRAANAKFRKELGCALPPKRQLLHAWALNFPHPVHHGAKLCLRAPLPSDFLEVLRRFWPTLNSDPALWLGMPARFSGRAVERLSSQQESLTHVERLWLQWWESSPEGRAYELECQQFFASAKRQKIS